jgi:hypothetical protein
LDIAKKQGDQHKCARAKCSVMETLGIFWVYLTQERNKVNRAHGEIILEVTDCLVVVGMSVVPHQL